MTCNQRLLGVACERCDPTGVPGVSSHSGKTATSNGGELLVTWTFIPPGKQDGAA